MDAANPAHVARAAHILRAGGTVAFPTETVYGLGANALSPEAVEEIFLAKQRPHWDPLIVHIADRQMLQTITSVPHDRGGSADAIVRLVTPNSSIAPLTQATSGQNSNNPQTPSNRTIEALIEKFWPGPLTLLLPRSESIPDLVTAGRPLVGVRMPAHPVALDLIRQAGVPIAAPSANTFGHTSPTTAAHVLADLDGRIDAVLDGGPTTVGLESTVAEVVGQTVRIYRPGAISAAMLESDAHIAERYLPTRRAESRVDSQPSPGMDLRHYAPRATLILVHGLNDEEILRAGQIFEQSLVSLIDQAFDGTEVVGVMLPEGWNPPAPSSSTPGALGVTAKPSPAASSPDSDTSTTPAQP